MRKILASELIVARDQNKVFVEKASSRRLSASDAIEKYQLLPGKGAAYVEFDIEEQLLEWQYNPGTQRNEYYILGNVDLRGKNPMGMLNF